MSRVVEEPLTQWILSMDARGSAPRQAMVQDMAALLLAARGTERVGKCLVSNYIKRTPALQSQFPRRYNYQRAPQEDPQVLHEWFDRVKLAIVTCSISLLIVKWNTNLAFLYREPVLVEGQNNIKEVTGLYCGMRLAQWEGKVQHRN